MKTKQLIAFTRGKFYVSLSSPVEMTSERKTMLFSLANELKRFGYILDNSCLALLSEDDIKEISSSVIPYLCDLFHENVGGEFTPLYPGFPQQVISKTDQELWENQARIYATLDYEEFLANNQWYSEKTIIEINEPHVVKAMSDSDFMKIPTSIMLSGNSLSSDTKEELEWFLDSYQDLAIPDRIPFKETMCIVMKHRPAVKAREINDILRYAFYLMGADPSLPHIDRLVKEVGEYHGRRSIKLVKNPKLGGLKLTRSQRRDVLSKIDALVIEKKRLDFIITDAKRFYGKWVLLSEKVHPGEYSGKYPEANRFFNILQDNSKSKNYKTWESKLQKMYDGNESVLDIAKYISTRPGELVRRFDSLLRKADKVGINGEDIMDVFLDTDGMKNKTLLELLNYYDKRNVDTPRLIKTKGSRRMFSLPILKGISKSILSVIQEVISRKVLINIDSRITEKDLAGKTVFIDPDLKLIPIPRDMRTASVSIPRCTKFRIPDDKNVVRLFTQWIDDNGTQDLDLHGCFFNEKLDSYQGIGWNVGLKGKNNSAVHSGDVRNRKGNCAEYIDIDIKESISAGYRYVIMDVINYNRSHLNELPAWLGYLYRDTMMSGDPTWVPENTEFIQKITSPAKQLAAWIVDLQERTIMLLDTDVADIPVVNSGIVEAIAKFFLAKQTFTTFDVVNQHYISRGATVLTEYPVRKEDEPEIKLDEEVLANDLAKDYTKVLEMIGE